MSNQLPPDADILGTMISQFIFVAYGFGPSQDICLPFAQQVIAEAARMHAAGVTGGPGGRKGFQLDHIRLDEIPWEADS
jgi:hypothetical protein